MPIWPFRSKQPELQDRAFEDLAQMFISNPEDPTPGGEQLDTARLDFTVDSLAVVDAHLEEVRTQLLEGQALMKFVLRGGAYVGEVIRRRAAPSKTWHWVDYDEAVRLDPRLSSLGKGLGTIAILWDGKDGFCFPLGKVGKYLENGAEDSVKLFAHMMIAGCTRRIP